MEDDVGLILLLMTITTRPAYRYAAEVLRVIDGDTYHLFIDQGFHEWTKQMIRLQGWSCPELNAPKGPEAKVAATALLSAASSLIVETDKDVMTFGRYVGRLYVDGVELGALLEAQGLAVRA